MNLKKGRYLVTILLALLVVPAAAFANPGETPVSFDSRGTVMKLTVEMNRKAGVFPDFADFEWMEIWQTETGLVIEKYLADGRRERTEAPGGRLETIRAKMDAYLLATASERRLNQEGRGSYLIQQIPLALGWYGTALTTMLNIDNARASSAVYLLGSSAFYFAPLLITNKMDVTHAHAHLSVGLGYRGIVTGFLLGQTFMVEDFRANEALALATSVGGQVGGYVLANDLSLGQANLVTAYADFGLLDGALLGFGSWMVLANDEEPRPLLPLCALVGQVGGGVLGRVAATRRPWTEGQVTAVRTGGFAGAAIPAALYYAVTNFVGDNEELHAGAVAAISIAGNIAGTALTERRVAPSRLSSGNGLIVAGTTIGASLVGAGLGFVLANEPRLVAFGGAAGCAVGLWGGIKLAEGLQTRVDESRRGALRLHLMPQNLAGLFIARESGADFRAPLAVLEF